MSNSISIETRENALIVRFIRPEIRNPLSIEVLESLDGIVDGARNSFTIEKLVFTGTGTAFASGANLLEIAAVTPETAKKFSLRGQRLMNNVANLSIPTVAAINGFCFGGALDLALACSKRIAAPDATFCHPGVGLGIITGWGGTQRLPRLIGEANALEIFFTAKPINALNALRIGLIDHIAQDPLVESLANTHVGRSS